MNELRRIAQERLAHGVPSVLVDVARTRGSVPRGAGTRMLVSLRGVDGTIGGGHLEWKAIGHARAMLLHGAGAAPATTLHYPLGPALGQCCGGSVTLAYSLLNRELLAQWPPALPRFFLQLYGAGHVGRAIARLLAAIDCEVDWIDERDDEFPAALGGHADWPAQIRRVACDGVEAEVDAAPAGAFYLVMTHRHDLDLRIVERIARRGDFGYLGLIGSKTKRERFFHRLERIGIAPATIARITCPIGVAGIDGKEPDVIAIAVVAQLLQQRSCGAAPAPADARTAARAGLALAD